MTQRVDLATVMDRLAVDAVITGYAVAVDDGDWAAYRALFTRGGRADYRSAGGIEAPAAEVAEWLAETMKMFPVRQHLIVNRRITLEDLGGSPGDRAEVLADFVNPMRLTDPADTSTAPNFAAGGRYTFALDRSYDGWLLRRVTVHERWRHFTPAGPTTAHG
ncbi:nuclear transport factor 2 family protein [Streptomyces sp. NBC_00239]|uniref:nuclear transport factor 2 family protein n=1 Tax=Streptomyces sp. NBC_00239 TaxID=2903640 RepID=UPI002E2923AA|nr:nuclear transport factor 2 family protein [Streptomyces sp. NBC_00239]